MPLEFEETNGNIVLVSATGTLTDDDYDEWVPRMEKLIDRWGRLRMIFDMTACDGWDLSGAWEEFKFEAKHRDHIKRVAVIGNRKWTERMSKASGLITGAEVKFFEPGAADEAREWIQVGW